MAKQIIYGEEARKAIERGVNQLMSFSTRSTALP